MVGVYMVAEDYPFFFTNSLIYKGGILMALDFTKYVTYKTNILFFA